MFNKKLWGTIFLGPAFLIMGIYLLYPSLQTFLMSFMDRTGSEFVGLENYNYAFTSESMLIAFRNNLLWLIIFTLGTVGLGLIFAILTDKVPYEKLAKSIIFMPMAISFVGAGIIWKFVYTYKPPIFDQIGLLNQIMVLIGKEPKGWLLEGPWVNNIALIYVGIWIWTGFSMVILSAAYKNIPSHLLEAAKVDGANWWQTFRYVVIPELLPTIIVVITSNVIRTFKMFDIIYVMTNGNYGTEVIANRMYKEMFKYRHFGRASAIAVILFILVLPVIIMNIKKMKQENN